MIDSNRFKIACLAVSLGFLLSGCQQPSAQKPSGSGSVEKETTTKPGANAPQKEAPHRGYNDAARFISGLPPEPGSEFEELSKTPEWIQYAASFDKSWTKLDASRMATMRKWASDQLNRPVAPTVFYPFSGPDFLHAATFFPFAKTYVLVALEPVGTMPDFQRMTADSRQQYFAAINRSLDSVLNFSFFKTDNMKVDLKQDLEGTLPILAIFLARTGNRIDNITSVEIGETGEVVAASAEPPKSGARKPKGVSITFKSADGHPKELDYFAVNVQNDSLKKTPAFTNYVAKLDGATTYLKSASYLMHKDYFSIIRTAILDHSVEIVQDDSGIPFRFFKPEKWDAVLYGVYSTPIEMFKEHKEADLAAAYKEANRAKPLPFGIGYIWRQGRSNLLVARKKISG